MAVAPPKSYYGVYKLASERPLNPCCVGSNPTSVALVPEPNKIRWWKASSSLLVSKKLTGGKLSLRLASETAFNALKLKVSTAFGGRSWWGNDHLGRPNFYAG
jgi:hypothetical protein